MAQPLISVVMPVYNGQHYLVDAVASIVEQSLPDWEMICVNDGSTDQSGQILDWFATQDSRIRVIHQANAGIVAALNRGCAAARAPLICRMDCDDLAVADRLEKQATYMRENPTCCVLGGAILEIDVDGDPLNVSRLPGTHEDILENLLNRKTGHFHPTTIIRSEALEAVGGYRQQYQWVEDHDLWLRLAQRGQLANSREVVLCYRQHASSICWQRTNDRRELMNQLLTEAYRARGLQVPAQVLLTRTINRTVAGPGKWARAAARGGYPRSVWKHLTQLMRSDRANAYKMRMTGEALLRLAIGRVRRLLDSQPPPVVPRFPTWQERSGRLSSAATVPEQRSPQAA